MMKDILKIDLQLFSNDMEEKDKYSQYEESFNNVNEETNAYYDMVKEQKFDRLLDKEVQLENAKNQALKQTRNAVNANGFGSQGYGSSLQSGIYGRYMNALNSNDRDYSYQIDELEQQRKQDLNNNKEEAYQQIVTLMSSGNNNMERVNEYLSSVGLGDYDTEGNFAWGNKPDSMSQADWTQLQYLYNLQNDSAKEYEDEEQAYATYSSLDALQNATYVNSQGKAESKLGNNFRLETNRIWYEASIGTYKNGDTLKVTNDNNQTIYLQWTPNGFRMVNADTYNNSSTQYNVYYTRYNSSINHTKVK